VQLKMFSKKFENAPSGFWIRHRFFLCVALGVLLLDQGSKFWVVDRLSEGFSGLSGFSEKAKKFLKDNPEQGSRGYHYMPKSAMEISASYLRFSYAENTGAAFSIFADWPEKTRRWFFNIIAIVAITAIFYFQLKLPKLASRKEVWIRLGLPLVLGGALGNYADRLARGFVVDFIQAHWQNKLFWPSFNIADIAISAGMVCLILDAFIRKEA